MSVAIACYLLFFCLYSSHARAQEEVKEPATEVLEKSSSARLYRTREEQREAGLQTRILPWLQVSGLAEAEALYEDFDTDGGRSVDSGLDDSASLQIGVLVDPLELVSAEVIAEYDTDRDKVTVDEALLSLEYEPWELSLGKMYTPLGVYFSNFATGPILEFGETQAREALTLALGPDDDLDVTVTAYRGRARKQGKGSRDWSFAASIEAWVSEHWSIGMSYQSDLADADSRPLEDFRDRYETRVGALSAYLLWAKENWEVSLEGLTAIDSYKELDQDRNHPAAWNTEFVYFPQGTEFELAFRLEGSHEIEEEPRYQFGPAVTWRTGKHASLTLEYLRGEFKRGLATTSNDDSYKHVDRIGAILSVAF